MPLRSPRTTTAALATCVVVAVTLAAGPAAAQQSTPASRQPITPAAGEIAAPYVAPASGTREVFTNFTNVIGKSTGWRTDYTDGKGNSGSRIGLFLPDNPAVSAVFNERLLGEFWPLTIGREVRVESQRFPLKWLTKLKVLQMDTVTVPAGRFPVYVVETIKQATVTRTPSSNVTFTLLYYAPSIGTVVRVVSREMAGPTKGLSGHADLVRLERPGKPTIGNAATAKAAADAAAAKAKASNP